MTGRSDRGLSAMLRPARACAFLAALAALGAARAPGETIAERLARAEKCVRQRRNHAEGVRLAESVIADPKARRADKIAAFDVLLDIHKRARKPAAQAATAGRLAALVADDTAAAARAYLVWAEALWQSRKRDEAVAQLEEYLKRHGGERRAAGAVRVRLGRFLLDLAKYDRAYALLDAAVRAGLDDDRIRREALETMAEAMRRKGDNARYAEVLGRILSPVHRALWSQRERSQHRRRYGESLVAMKLYKSARQFYQRSAKDEADAEAAQYYAMAVGDTYAAENRHEQALAAYGRVFAEHAGVCEHWYETQCRIAEVLMKMGRFAEAVRAGRIALDAADRDDLLRRAIDLVGRALKAADGHVARANAFINYQRYGPAGEDGKAGTKDDLSDPLAKIGYPSYPDRAKAFAEARENAGDDAWAARHCARTFIYLGRPKDALRMYLDAFARCDHEQFTSIGREMIVVGVRAVRGYAVGLKAFYEFVNYGPAGPDGKAGTVDDLKDPFAALGVRRGVGASGGRGAAPARADVRSPQTATLREAARLLLAFALNEAEDEYSRRDALRALIRVQEALADWRPPTRGAGAGDAAAWYIRRAGETRSHRLEAAWLAVGQLAAKGGAYHLGGAHAFWRTVDAARAGQEEKRRGDVRSLRTSFGRTVSSLSKPRAILPGHLRLWKLESLRLSPSHLRPYPEPKQR